MIPLRICIESLDAPLVRNGRDLTLDGISCNSGEVRKNFLFCAVRGTKFDGRTFLGEALKNGASAIVSDDPELSVPEELPHIIVPDAGHAWALLCEAEAGFPAGDLELFAVTGTNGKTTTAFLLRNLLEKTRKRKYGLISTVLYDDCSGKLIPGSRTTPDPRTFQKLLAEMRRNGAEGAVMEASSHGLHQGRTGHARFSAGIFTNLTGDHLDYHKTMEAYFDAKKILFTDLLRQGGTAVINIDDPWGEKLAGILGKQRPDLNLVTFSAQKEAVLRAENIRLEAERTGFDLVFREGPPLPLVSPFIGLHNLYNLSEALGVLPACGKSLEAPEKMMQNLPQVPGRLEKFRLPSGGTVFVDYAHTDDALERVLTALRPLCKGKLVCVFGCGGDRDRTKRPRMGSVVSRLADLVCLTSDNPRSEDPEAILDEIAAGIPAGKKYLRTAERKQAIFQALSLAGQGDLVLIAGKGHETTQEICGKKYPFDDRDAVREYIKETQEKAS